MNPFSWVRAMVRNACHAGMNDFLQEVGGGPLAADLAAAARATPPALPAAEDAEDQETPPAPRRSATPGANGRHRAPAR